MTTRDDLVSRLLFAAENTEGCLYSQRKMLKEAASALEAKDAEIARLTATNTELVRQVAYLGDRISDLERQLAEETERCARVADGVAERAEESGSQWIGHRTIPKAIAAAIRGGAK
jgi:hypothetical protein